MQAEHVPAAGGDGSQGPAHAGAGDLQRLAQPFAVLHNGLGARRRCGSPDIGDQIGDGHVDFMPHGRDHGDRAGDDRTRHHLFVKRPEVFERTPTTRDDQHIHQATSSEGLNRFGNLLSRALALDARAPHDHTRPGGAAADDGQDVGEGRARQRRDDTHGLGKAR